tara:strand:- start:224 stop:451 length:228 start_codon:yes stop_codon:yes gene_type:complete
MKKNYFHNKYLNNENKEQEKIIPVKNINRKINVDINKLLNRVKIEEKVDTKKKIFFYSSIILGICFFSFLVVIIK